MIKSLNNQGIDQALRLLDGRLVQAGAPPVNLVVCGGAALIMAGLLSRTTRDVDIVALLDMRQLIAAVTTSATCKPCNRLEWN